MKAASMLYTELKGHLRVTDLPSLPYDGVSGEYLIQDRAFIGGSDDILFKLKVAGSNVSEAPLTGRFFADRFEVIPVEIRNQEAQRIAREVTSALGGK